MPAQDRQYKPRYDLWELREAESDDLVQFLASPDSAARRRRQEPPVAPRARGFRQVTEVTDRSALAAAMYTVDKHHLLQVPTLTRIQP